MPVAPTLIRVAHEWTRRVEAEYRSAALSQEFGLWLTRAAAPIPLVGEALRIAADELEHARLAHLALVATGDAGDVAIDRKNLALRVSSEGLECSVVDVGLNLFALGETVAVPLFRMLRRDCVVPAARQALDRAAHDEPRHSSFGWAVLNWMAHADRPLVFARIEVTLEASLRSMRAMYGDGLPDLSLSEAERSWGLCEPSEYVGTLDRSIERDVLRRLDVLGFDGRRAWDNARRPACCEEIVGARAKLGSPA